MKGIENSHFRQIAVLVAIVGAIIVNTLSNFFPLNGLNVGQLSNTLFTSVLIIPANYAFAIWGLVYLALLAFGIYQLQPTQRHVPKLQQSGWLLVMASIAQVAWIYLFQARLFFLSIIAMLAILIPLLGMYRILKVGNRTSRPERWFLEYPISLYTGWIAVATVVNVAIGLYSLNWDGWGVAPSVWTVLLVLVSAVIAMTVAVRHRDPVLPMVVVWGLVAIAVRQWGIPLIALTSVALAAGITAVVLAQQVKS